MRFAMLALFSVTMGFSAHASDCLTLEDSKLIQDLRQSFHKNEDVTLTRSMVLHMDSQRHEGSDEVGTVKKDSIVRVFRLSDMSLPYAIDGVYVEVVAVKGDMGDYNRSPELGFLNFEDLNVCPFPR